jgi:hypothetical protein
LQIANSDFAKSVGVIIIQIFNGLRIRAYTK